RAALDHHGNAPDLWQQIVQISESTMPTITVDTRPRHDISPRFYMQFMEPLGSTDSSVAACWNVLEDKWRDDFVEITRDLAPGSIRWGGILTSFWKWRESVGDP